MLADKKWLQLVVLISAFLFLAAAGTRLVCAQNSNSYRQTITPPQDIPYNNDPPIISISSPTNQTYDTSNVALDFTVTKPTSWNDATVYNVTKYMGIVNSVIYSLDGTATQLSIDDSWTSKSPLHFSVNLTGFANGVHQLNINASGWCLYAPALFGDRYANQVEGVSNTITFTINEPPKISLLSPMSATFYNGTSVPLNFTVDKAVSSITYSLDTEANATIYGNTTLPNLTDGPHTLQVFAQVQTGSVGYAAVNFTVDLPPEVVLLSPSDSVYNTTVILVNFTVNKPASWIAYSLDVKTNVTVSGNTTLADLSYGNHTLTIYAEDLAGNKGRSQNITFARYPEMAPSPLSSKPNQASAYALVIAGIASAIVVCVSFAVFRFKRKRERQKNELFRTGI